MTPTTTAATKTAASALNSNSASSTTKSSSSSSAVKRRHYPHDRQLSKKELAVRFCHGVIVTSVWLCVNGALVWGLDQFSRRIKIVEDYGDYDYD